jgi:hypothetical protein
MQGIKSGVLGLALSTFIGNAWAADVCARAQDLTALQVAAVQQELMVAAFTCNDFGLYNSFVIGYQKPLQDSDQALQAFFLRLNPATGAAEYHTFKTKLANSYSLRSSGNGKAYCGNALRVFHAALNEGSKSLAEFAMAQPASFAVNYDVCGERIPGGAMTAKTAAPALAPVIAPLAAAPNVISAEADSGVAVVGGTAQSSPDRNNSYYSSQNGGRYAAPPPPAPQQSARRYDARDPNDRSSSDSYGYSNRYGERDPYYRNPYDRYWYGAPPQYYYLRRR